MHHQLESEFLLSVIITLTSIFYKIAFYWIKLLDVTNLLQELNELKMDVIS